MGAVELSENVNLLNEEFPNLIKGIAIGLATLDYDQFVKENNFSIGEIYIDEKKVTYDALDFGKPGIFSGYGMLNPKVYIAGYKASQKGIKGNMQGDGFQLGGTFILDKEGGIVFSHIQQNYADHPQLEDMRSALQTYTKLH